ncbi:homocysteine S-methyltransferase [Streptomyces sp. TP-A0874]|uniref:homocysteine S-methyltransferase n=1 Tax=Streptomyces sp. TP-A0874 TaxID=549819 RepID=UPI000852B1EB|nr:homocysteine S-methyltransferase [Streptomyces sp. TP-A0874]
MHLPDRRLAAGPDQSLAAGLAEGTVILDGGLSNQLVDQGCDLSGALWSARLLADDPRQIEAAHTAYVRAGAQVLITASYQASYQGFAHRGLPAADTSRLLRRSVELARRAASARRGRPGESTRSGHGAQRGQPEVWVAASVGPYGAMLADGSEYRGRYGLSVAELERFHRPRIESLASAAPDVLALETVPDIDEAEALLRAAEGTGVPVWLSYTVDGGRTRAGQPLGEAFALAAEEEQVIAVGVNCCTPAEASRAVPLAAESGKPVVVYPNSGESWDTAAARWSGHRTFDPERVHRWQDAGARLVGGCCRVGPGDITELAWLVRPDTKGENAR